ncbi:MAG: glycine--tRNA ligase subunit beta [bacterium]
MLNSILEIGCEEIPARFLPGFLEDLKKKAEEKLTRERLTFSRVETLGTARRLTLYIEDLAPKQPDITEEVKGPLAEAAFDSTGKPTQAAIGFAKARDLPLENLTVKTVNGKNFVFAKAVRKGENTSEVLKTLFPEIISSLYQPLSMRWGNLDFKFIRPIHSLLALYGNKVIKFELAGIKSSDKTFGHRHIRITRYPLRITNALLSSYKATLKKLGVIVDQNERKTLIKTKVEAAAKKLGAQAAITEALLSEVTFLVENPEIYVGKFNSQFLEVPGEVLITSMKKNQKYFPLLDNAGKLLPRFAVVTDGCKNKGVVAGNEKVLSARLSDARFFFDEDKKTPLRSRIADLEKVAFMEKLGNMLQKAERTARLSEWIAKRLGADPAICRKIAELCKADLTTKMVFEFPELQGTIGGHYALLSSEDPRVAKGIAEHYQPRFADDTLPESKEGVVVALADRLDTIVGAFSVGYVPTGSEDPYGLRRAVHGIIRLLNEKQLDLSLGEPLEVAYKLFAGTAPFSKIKQDIMTFFVGRLRPLLIEKGLRYDVVDAALYSFTDILKVIEKAEALNGVLREPWLPGVIASADRLSRIAGGTTLTQVSEQNLEDKEEKELYSLYLQVKGVVSDFITKEEWIAASKELSNLTAPIELFFDKVLVMHKDERLKANRLALLKSLEKLYLSVADFRKIIP